MRLPIEVHNKLIPFKGFSWVDWRELYEILSYMVV